MTSHLLKLCILWWISLSAPVLFARAGGGDNFGSSSRGGGGGGGGYSSGSYSGGGYRSYGSSGGGGGSVGAETIVFAFMLIGAVVIASRFMGGRLTDKSNHHARRERPLNPAKQLEIDLRKSKLFEMDPAFDEEEFIERAKQAFLNVQNAWSSAKLEPIRPFVTDGVYEKFSVQLQGLKKRGHSNTIEQLKVLRTDIAQLDFEGAFTYLTLAIKAVGDDRTVDDYGRVLSKTSAPFKEYWTFLRKSSVATRPGALGLLEGTCPCCGAGLLINQNAKCGSCGSLVRSGDFDWVLSEITQNGQNLGGENLDFLDSSLAERDENASTQLIEDAASVMFSRLLQAAEDRNLNPVKRCASPKFLKRLESRKFNIPYVKAAIGSMEVCKLLEDEERAQDLCFVDVVWSAFKSEDSDRIKYKSMLVLARKMSAAKEKTAGFGVAHCHGCGRPDDGSTQNECPACSGVFNDGSKEWVLIDFIKDRSITDYPAYTKEKADDLRA